MQRQTVSSDLNFFKANISFSIETWHQLFIYRVSGELETPFYCEAYLLFYIRKKNRIQIIIQKEMPFHLLLFLYVIPLVFTQFMTWQQYCVEFHRDCSDTERQAIYEQRIQSWRSIQSFTPKENNFTDRTQAERRAMAGLKEESSLERPLGNSMSPSLKAEAPNRFNWEDQGVKTSVKNQGQCGSCWSFAAIAQAEAKLIIDKKADSSIDLSEQYLLKCTYSSTCQGGYMRYAMQEALNVPTEEEYPYYPYRYQGNQICESATHQIGTSFRQYFGLTQNQVITLLLEFGPLAIGIRVQDYWYDYSRGIYSCQSLPGVYMNHAVLLVGYTQEYWIIKNQWGKSWGMDGYMHISRNSQTNCEIGGDVSFIVGESIVPEKKDEDNIDGGQNNNGGEGNDNNEESKKDDETTVDVDENNNSTEVIPNRNSSESLARTLFMAMIMFLSWGF